MSEENILIRSSTENDLAQIASLINTTYLGREISDLLYLQWEYEKNPDGKAIITIAEYNSQVVSQYAIIPRTFSFQGEKLKGSVSVNTITHPQHRGKNLFSQLAAETFKRCAEQEIFFTIGFPNPVS